mmetsp:Transcript_9124/g.20316  ORF Transcript_9124/g.20316 Transcript_9124/m.20316 type:complete len:274 (+) Transcript_9124:55-876(+)
MRSFLPAVVALPWAASLAPLFFQLVAGADELTTAWQGESVRDLHKEYYNIFRHGNRNAASHLWSSFLLERSHEMTVAKFELMFSGFCAVSGSPVQPQERTRYRLNLEKVGGGRRTGYMYYCCWPCVCDTQDFIKVDTRNVTLAGGVVRQYHFAVIGDPCKNEAELSKPFVQPFYGRGETTLLREAPEVRCSDKKDLIGAHASDHGHTIISMFFDEKEDLKSMDESLFESHCTDRKNNGYNSGMGEIFRKVAAITPVDVGCASGESGECPLLLN